jgi:hypothetical protein
MDHQVALKSWSIAMGCSVVMFALIVSMVMVPKGNIEITFGIFMVYLLLMVACHVLVGMAAKAAAQIEVRQKDC